MGRPYYEDTRDLTIEWNIAERVNQKWQFKIKKLPLCYGFDFGFLRNEDVKVIAEIKRRYVNYTTYPDIILSANKSRKGLSWIKYGLIPVFIVEFNDGIYIHRLKSSYNYRITWGGRTDRDDWQDEEPVFRIPINLFKPVEIKYDR